jgi:hypothetical protein
MSLSVVSTGEETFEARGAPERDMRTGYGLDVRPAMPQRDRSEE